MKKPHSILSGSVAALLRKSHLALAAASLCFAATGHSQNITFGPATTIAGDTDVFTLGVFNYAYDLSNSAQTVNGVSFAAGASTTALGTDVTMSGFDGANNGNAFGSAGGGTWSGLSAPYRAVLQGGNYTNTGTTATVNLNNLVSGHVYAAQVWVNDNRSLGGLNRSEIISSTGGNSIALDYNNTNGDGGVGQFTIGGFTAASTSRAFTLLANNAGSQSSQLNALQVRDVTGIWSGATNGNWDGGTANFTGGQIFATVAGLTTSVSFADTDGFKNAVTNSNITVAAGGASIGTVNFLNNAVNYIFNSADANGITGGSIVNKTGTGTVTFKGANTYSGATSVSNGILTFGNTAARSSGTTVTTAAAGTVGLGVGAISGDYSDANVADLFNTNTLAGFNLNAGSGVAIDTTAGNFTQSTALTAARALTKLGNNTLTLTGANTYVGATSVNGGILTFPNTAARSPGTTVTVAAAGTVGLGVGAVSGDYSDANVADLFNTNTLAGFNLNAASGVALDTTAGNFTQSTALTAARALTKLGNNTLTLTGANTYSGRTTISSGTLELGGAAGKLGAGPITNNGTLRLNRTNALSIAGPIAGTGTLTQVGAGATTLSGVSTYSGATTITAGTLRPAVAGGSSLWLDSAKTSSLATSGTAVTQWNDAGGGTNFATQGTAAARPNLTTDNAFAGPSKTMVDFGATTSSGQWMQFNANITDIRSVFWVMKGGNFLLGSTGAYDFHREEATVASPTGKIWSIPYTSANIQNGQTYLNGTQVNGTTTALSGGYQMIDVITTGNVQSNALANDRNIGGRIGGQQIGEVIIFNAALSNTDRQQVETYLNYKWFGTGPGVGNLLPVATPVTISGTGTLDLSGENYQTVASLSSSDPTTRVTLGSAAFTVGDANDTTFTGVISDTGTLTKVGSGKLTLTGPNTHSGRTTISNGTLEISGAAGKLGSGSITNNAALRFSPSTTLSVPAAIDGTGGLTQAGTGTTTLTGALTYSGATDITGGTLRIVGAPTAPVAGAARRFDASNLGLADGAGVSTWNDLSGNGANATVPGGNATPTYIANAGTGTGLGAINLPKNGGAATSGAFTFTRDANVRSMFSIFKGNSFLATDATGGTYALHRPTDDNAADALLASYGQINYLGSVYVNSALVGTPLSTAMPTNSNNGYNLVEVITNGNAFALDSFNKDRGNIHAGNQSQAEVLIYDTVLTESQRLHNESYLSNKWFGTGAAAALPSNTPVTISNGGTLDLIGAQTIGSLSSTDALGSKVINDTSLTVGNATSTTFDGIISGPGTLTKTGTGRLTLSGANTYAGVTTISNGTLELAGSAGTLGTSTSTITNNGTLSINRTNALVLRNAIAGTGALTQAGTGTTTLTGTSTYAGATNITSGTLSVSVVTGAARRFDASGLGLANGGNVTAWNDLSGNGANATVPGGNGAPTYIANAGTGTGLGAISFLGNTNATDSQALSFARDTEVRSMFSVFKGSSFLATDSVNYSLHRPTDNTPADPLLIDYGQVNFLGTVYVNSSVVATPTTTPMPTTSNNGYNLVEIVGNGNAFALDSFNKDRIYHSGNQSQAEVIMFDTVVSNEQRQQIETYLNYKWFGTGVGIGNLLPATTPVTLSGGGTLDLSGENYQTIASLSSSDPTSRVTLGAAALTVGDASSTAFAGVISGPGKLTKVGNGTLTLAGTSTYTGPTTVNAGTLIVSGSLSGSAVTVDGSGSTLGGGGTINGTVTVQNGATIAPGNSPGKLSTLSLSMASGTTLSLELNGATPVSGYDQLSVTGAVDLGGATLSISTGVGFVNGNYFVVLNDGTDAITGTFTGLAEGGMFSVGDKDFTITYTANAEGMSLTGGNDVAFTVVPEPGSAMLLLGGIAAMLGVRRRRVEPS